MQKQPFPVAEGSKKFEDWGEGVKNFRAGGGGFITPLQATLVENGLISYGSQYLLWDYLPGFEQNFISENQ